MREGGGRPLGRWVKQESRVIALFFLFVLEVVRWVGGGAVLKCRTRLWMKRKASRE